MNTLLDTIVPAAWAASAGGAHSASIIDLVFPLVNFLIFAYLVKRYALPPFKAHLRKRREGILNSIVEANEAKSRAEKHLQRYKQLLADLEAESANIREGLRTEGEREKAHIVAEAEDFAAKLKADADFMAQQEMKMAREEIRGELARLAEEGAERVIEKQLTERDQDRLIANFAQHLRS